jgi:hypothetical protein
MFERATTASIAPRAAAVVSADQPRDRSCVNCPEDHLDANEILTVGRCGSLWSGT